MGKKRVPKTLKGKLSDLDDHIFLLREHLHGIKEDVAHLKVIAAELRNLVCFSRRQEGLLWRLTDEMGVIDAVGVHLAGKLNPKHPMAKGLKLAYVPIMRAGFGDPKLEPGYYSLRDIIKENEAIFIFGSGLTHEYLIKAVSQQMGTAHEDDEIDVRLASLTQLFVGGVQPYIPILVTDAELTLEVGERTLEKAQTYFGYERKTRPSDYGDITVAVRCGLNKFPKEEVEVFRLQSYISGVDIRCIAKSDCMTFKVSKKGELVKVKEEEGRIGIMEKGGFVRELRADYAKNWKTGVDAVFSFLYSSHRKKARTITNNEPQNDGEDIDIGWVDAREMLASWDEGDESVYRQLIFLWNRLLSPNECAQVLDLTSEDFDFRKHMKELKEREPFPT